MTGYDGFPPTFTTYIDITNEEYFFMIDNQVRSAMQKYETEHCLPIAKKVLEKANVSLSDLDEYPTEGYYYETTELKLYFQILRNIQHNEGIYSKINDSEELKELQRVCHNDLFGIEDPLKRPNNSPLKRRYDILTLTMEDGDLFDTKAIYPWSIESVMKGISKYYAGRVNLVELAYLTKNPKCLCCGAETNALYRAIACLSGSYSIQREEFVWKVDKEVEDLGRKIASAYNQLMQGNFIEAPTLERVRWFNRAPKLPRVSVLGYLSETGLYYHWILDEYYALTEKYSSTVITTESYAKTRGGTEFFGNMYNLSPAA